MIPVPSGLSLKLIFGMGCALLLALLVHDRNHWKAKTSHYAEQLAGERAAHAATVANYRAAADRARAVDAANFARVKGEQAAINERTDDDFESRIAAARAAAQRLRGTPGATANPRDGGDAPMPAAAAAAQGAAHAAGENRLPHSDKRAGFPEEPLGADDALIATEQAIQLDALIQWVRAQAEVDANGR